MILERNSGNAAARLVADPLTGQEIPHVVLSGGWERPMDLRSIAHLSPIVLYFYPGCNSSTDDDEETTLIDAALHRTFRDHQPDLEARNYRAIGISSQSNESQQRAALASRATQTLLCDPELELARALPLPTFTRYDARWYERLVMVSDGGRIEKVFFPVADASRSAAQVIAWLTMRQRPAPGDDVAS